MAIRLGVCGRTPIPLHILEQAAKSTPLSTLLHASQCQHTRPTDMPVHNKPPGRTLVGGVGSHSTPGSKMAPNRPREILISLGQASHPIRPLPLSGECLGDQNGEESHLPLPKARAATTATEPAQMGGATRCTKAPKSMVTIRLVGTITHHPFQITSTSPPTTSPSHTITPSPTISPTMKQRPPKPNTTIPKPSHTQQANHNKR